MGKKTRNPNKIKKEDDKQAKEKKRVKITADVANAREEMTKKEAAKAVADADADAANVAKIKNAAVAYNDLTKAKQATHVKSSAIANFQAQMGEINTRLEAMNLPEDKSFELVMRIIGHLHKNDRTGSLEELGEFKNNANKLLDTVMENNPSSQMQNICMAFKKLVNSIVRMAKSLVTTKEVQTNFFNVDTIGDIKADMNKSLEDIERAIAPTIAPSAEK